MNLEILIFLKIISQTNVLKIKILILNDFIQIQKVFLKRFMQILLIYKLESEKK